MWKHLTNTYKSSFTWFHTDVCGFSLAHSSQQWVFQMFWLHLWDVAMFLCFYTVRGLWLYLYSLTGTLKLTCAMTEANCLVRKVTLDWPAHIESNIHLVKTHHHISKFRPYTCSLLICTEPRLPVCVWVLHRGGPVCWLWSAAARPCCGLVAVKSVDADGSTVIY